MRDITDHPDIALTRGGMILIGLMSGGDYQQGGLTRCGTITSHGLAKCGFGDTLYQAANNLSREELPGFLTNWRHGLRHELRTNSKGHIGKRYPSLANSIPEDFPDIDILLSYTNPITSESMGRAHNNLNLTWRKEPDLGKLAATCEFYFEWGYKEAIIKRFRTVVWPSAVLRILRRAALNLDTKTVLAQDPTHHFLSTPPKKKGKAITPDPTGTPSKMVARHFSSMSLYPPRKSDDEDENIDPLIVKIHSKRNHASTDGILEYRLEIAPAQLVRIAESGIKGTRTPEGPDEWASEEDQEEDGKKATKKSPTPESHLRMWMPACMVRLVEPQMVEEYEELQEKKGRKKAGGGRPRAVSASKVKSQEITAAGEKGGPELGLSNVKSIAKAVKSSGQPNQAKPKIAGGAEEELETEPPSRVELAAKSIKSRGQLGGRSKAAVVEEEEESESDPPPRVKTRAKSAKPRGDLKSFFPTTKTSTTKTLNNAGGKAKPSAMVILAQHEPLSHVVELSDSDSDLPAHFYSQGPSPSQPLEGKFPQAANPRIKPLRDLNASRPKTNGRKRYTSPRTTEPTNQPCKYDYLSVSDTSGKEDSISPTLSYPKSPRPIISVLDDDPFNSLHSRTSSPLTLTLPPAQARKKSSPQQDQLTNPPRKSTEHSPPRRVVTQDNIDNGVSRMVPLPGSPSSIRPSQSEPAKLPLAPVTDVIEISSDSDLTPPPSPMSIRPLLLAKARTKTATNPASSRKNVTGPTTRGIKRTNVTNIHPKDIIDLT